MELIEAIKTSKMSYGNEIWHSCECKAKGVLVRLCQGAIIVGMQNND